MDYLNFIYEIFSEDEFINECLDKDLEMFLDSNPKISFEDTKIKAFKTSDELDRVNYIKNKGYKISKIIRHKNFASIIFLKIRKY